MPTPEEIDQASALGLTAEDLVDMERKEQEREADKPRLMAKIIADDAIRQQKLEQSPYYKPTFRNAPPKVKRGNPEGQVQKACMDWLKLHRVFHYRQNNLPTPMPDGTFRPVHFRGLPDCVAIIAGRYIGIEFKSDIGRQSEDQKFFEERCKASGGLYFLIRSIDDMERLVKPIL